MNIENLLEFQPIDLTQIIVYSITLFVLLLFFRAQLTAFFEGLRTRPITVTMDGSETSIKLDAPVEPKFITTGLTDPTVTSNENQNWGENLEYINNIEGLEKMGFSQLTRDIESLNENEVAVLNYQVNDPNRPYFQDKNMLKYLSLASEKIRYLALYERNKFVGYIRIEKVIKGLASSDYQFEGFGDRLKTNEWTSLPGLIKSDKAFHKIPTIKELFEKLETSGESEIPLVENGQLKSILNYETVSGALYKQTQQST